MSLELRRKSAVRNDDQEVSSWYVNVSPQTGTHNYGPVTTLCRADRSSYNGYAISGFHRLVRSGVLLPQTPFEKYELVGDSEGSMSLLTSSGDTWTIAAYNPFTDWVIPYDDILNSMPPDASNFVQEAAAQIYSEGYDALTAVAESREVIPMVVETAKKLYSLRLPRNWRKALRYRSLANDWMSARYGWRTFVYDCKNLNEALTTYKERNKKTRYRKRAGTKYTGASTTGGPFDFSLQNTNFTGSREVADVWETSLRGSVVADVSIPSFQVNLAQTAWELVPYSFVVDWFLSVGKAIAATSFLMLQSNYAASWGFRTVVKRTFSVTGNSVTSGVTGSFTQTASCSLSYEKRVPCTIPLTPHMTFRLNTAKVVDMMAMVIQKVR